MVRDMGIRNISRQPCPTCGMDTMHAHMKCLTCGHVNETGSQARSRVHFGRVVRLLKSGVPPLCVDEALTRYQRQCAAAKRAERAATPSYTSAKNGLFGTNRIRTRT
jgi:hypothetical protein